MQHVSVEFLQWFAMRREESVARENFRLIAMQFERTGLETTGVVTAVAKAAMGPATVEGSVADSECRVPVAVVSTEDGKKLHFIMRKSLFFSLD